MIETRSTFYYGITIDSNTQVIPFSEGAGEILAELRIGSYTLTDFVNEISLAMNNVSSNNYVISVNRDNRLITISGDSNFELLTNSSLLVGVSAFPYIGFDNLTDKTGSNSYTGSFGSGSEFLPQYYLQSYVPFINENEISGSSINESATGQIEVISYGLRQFMTCNIRFSNNSIQSCVNSPFDYNENGYDDLITFMSWCIGKKPVEFIADISDRNAFDKCIYETSVKYLLREQLKDGLKDHYETGTIKFRKV